MRTGTAVLRLPAPGEIERERESGDQRFLLNS